MDGSRQLHRHLELQHDAREVIPGGGQVGEGEVPAMGQPHEHVIPFGPSFLKGLLGLHDEPLGLLLGLFPDLLRQFVGLGELLLRLIVRFPADLLGLLVGQPDEVGHPRAQLVVRVVLRHLVPAPSRVALSPGLLQLVFQRLRSRHESHDVVLNLVRVEAAQHRREMRVDTIGVRRAEEVEVCGGGHEGLLPG